MAHPLFKRALHLLLGDYQYWKIFCIDLPQPGAELASGISIKPLDFETLGALEEDDGFRERMSFGGEDAQGFGLYVDGELAAMQWYWWGARYEAERRGRSWRLPSDAAKSVGLYTLPHHRGKGYAVMLKRQSVHLMSRRGFGRLYARVWHSHKSSIRVQEKAGWKLAGSYIEIRPFGKLFKARLPTFS